MRSSSTVGRHENVQHLTQKMLARSSPLLPFPVARRANVREAPGDVHEPAGPAGLGGTPESTDQTHSGHGTQPQAAHRSLPHGQDPALVTCSEISDWVAAHNFSFVTSGDILTEQATKVEF